MQPHTKRQMVDRRCTKTRGCHRPARNASEQAWLTLLDSRPPPGTQPRPDIFADGSKAQDADAEPALGKAFRRLGIQRFEDWPQAVPIDDHYNIHFCGSLHCRISSLLTLQKPFSLVSVERSRELGKPFGDAATENRFRTPRQQSISEVRASRVQFRSESETFACVGLKPFTQEPSPLCRECPSESHSPIVIGQELIRVFLDQLVPSRTICL